MRNLLGGKGCELAEMTNLGIPVPPGFTITTQAWVHSRRAGGKWPDGLWEQILEHLERLEQVADARFGDRERPLLVSVRSGARVSMPGMMETILNLGLNDATVEGLAARSGNERFAWDCYRRFITMFSVVVLDVRREVFDDALDAVKSRLGATADADVPAGRAAEARPDLPGRDRGAHGRPVPAGRARPARAGHRRGVRLLVREEGDGVPAHPRHPRGVGHRGDRHGDGVRQPRRGLRHRGRVHARSAHGRGALLRGVPAERPGRGRGGGDPHPAPDRGPARANADDLRRASRHRHPARAALQGHAGHRVHDPGGRRSTSSRRAAASARPGRRCEWRWTSSASTSSISTRRSSG